MLPGVTAGGAEGEAPSPAPQTTRRTRGGWKRSSGSFWLCPLCARMRPQLCRGRAAPAGSAVPGPGEKGTDQRAPGSSRSPRRGSGLCGTWSIPGIRASGGGCVPWLKIETMGWEQNRAEPAPHNLGAPHKPHREEHPAALSPSPGVSSRSCGEKGAFGATLAASAGAGAHGRPSCCRWRRSRRHSPGAGGRLARPLAAHKGSPFSQPASELNESA